MTWRKTNKLIKSGRLAAKFQAVADAAAASAATLKKLALAIDGLRTGGRCA